MMKKKKRQSRIIACTSCGKKVTWMLMARGGLQPYDPITHKRHICVYEDEKDLNSDATLSRP